MLQSILNSFFGCAHQRTTFPLTPSRKSAGTSASTPRSGAYVVCLDCGKEFAYDWSEMRVGAAVQPLAVGTTAGATASIN
ncbi:MAG: hypothetical protein WBY44_25820 [Bryobacteraceae bacterium]|jgi:hypothetical protein